MSRLLTVLGIIWLMVFCSNLSYAQSKVDSLVSVRKMAIHDSVRVEIDITLTNHYRVSNSDSAIFFGERALELSRSESMQAYPEFESRVLTYLGLAYGYTPDQKRKGISYLRQSLPYFIDQQNVTQLAYNYFCIGYFYGSHLHEYDSAVFYYNQATVLSDTLNTSYVSGSYNNAGLALYRKGDYESSMKYYVTALEMRKETGSVYDMACTILNMGMAYDKLDQPESAKNYYMEALSGFIEAGHIPNQAVSQKNIADVLTSQDSLSKALTYYDEASKLFKKVNSIYLLSDCFLNMGNIYVKLGEYQKAEDFLLNAESTVPTGASDRFKSQIYVNLARVKKVVADSVLQLDAVRKKKTLREGAGFGEKALDYANSSNSLEVKVMATQSLLDIYEALGEYQKGLRYARALNQLKAQTSEQTQSDAMARMATEFETERIKNENALLEETQKAQNARLKQQNLLIYGIALVLVLILVIATIIYRGRLRLQKANGQIEQSLSEKELLLKEIHHRVKNNLQVISSLLELQSFGIEDEKALSTFMEGQNRVKAMALIHQKLYQNENLATIDFGEYAEQLSQDLAGIYPNAGKVTTSVNAGSKVKFDIDTAVPLGLILNELISNSYKYAFEDKEVGELQVSIESIGDGKHQLMVEDNGRGLSKGFDLEKAKSLGLRLVNRLAEQLYGTVEYYGDHGAKFVINFEESIRRNPS